MPKQRYVYLLVFVSLLAVFVNLLPFLIHGRIFFGYDYGFYRRYLIQPLESFPNTPVPGISEISIFPRIFLDFLRLLGLPPDLILAITAIFFTALTVIILFYLVRPYWGEKTALLSSLFLALSPIRYTAYWYFFLKNIIALPFLLLFLFLLQKKSWWAIAPGLAVLFTHHTTSVVLIIFLGVYLLLARLERKYIFSLLIILLAVFVFLYGKYYLQAGLNISSGIFLTRKEFIFLSFPVLVLAIWGAKEFLTKFRSSLFVYAVVTFTFPIFSFPFYERILVFLDITVAIAAALGIKTLLKEIRSASVYSKACFCLVLVIIASWLVTNLGRQINNLSPPLTPDEMQEIQNLSTLIPPEAAILTSAIYAPWAQGWTLNKVFAPTILSDSYTKEQWLLFWKAEDPAFVWAFLKQFPKPLYLFLDKFQQERLSPLGTCLNGRSKFVFAFGC